MTAAASDFRSYRFSRVPMHVGDLRDFADVVRPFGLAWRVVSLLSEGSCHWDLSVQEVGRNGSRLEDFGVSACNAHRSPVEH